MPHCKLGNKAVHPNRFLSAASPTQRLPSTCKQWFAKQRKHFYDENIAGERPHLDQWPPSYTEIYRQGSSQALNALLLSPRFNYPLRGSEVLLLTSALLIKFYRISSGFCLTSHHSTSHTTLPPKWHSVPGRILECPTLSWNPLHSF